MRAAARQLADVNARSAQVGYSVGFNKPTQFSREFREIFGVTPRQFHRLLTIPPHSAP